MSSIPQKDVSSTKKRDLELFTELSGRYQLQVLGYIYATLHNLDDAEDVYQQTSIIMWDKFDEYEVGSDFLKWACTVARYEVLNFLRTAKNRPRYFSDEYIQQVAELPSGHDSGRLESRQQALNGCLRRLRNRDQQLIERCYGGATKIHEVARQLGRTPESVYTSLRRIRRTLHECINRALALESGHE
ncbi:sigma-70 family RNA polymerase sigma factor [Aeoliella sp.]|uniref:sigma-70 family RNA polymerase sigma factor n=1 Tax=Aeoliella sp. TaxID=2795800 RepID=UPI003CCBA5BD